MASADAVQLGGMASAIGDLQAQVTSLQAQLDILRTGLSKDLKAVILEALALAASTAVTCASTGPLSQQPQSGIPCSVQTNDLDY